MAQATSVYIRHNLDTSSLDNFRKDLEQRLNVKINLDFTLSDMDESMYSNEPEEEYTLYIYSEPDDFYMELYCKSASKSLFTSKYYFNITEYCVEMLGEWWAVTCWLDDNYKNREEYDKERKVIYDVARLFGADECVMMNGEWLVDIAGEYEDGVPLKEAIEHFEEKNPTKKLRKYGRYSTHDEWIEVPRKINVISPHENKEGKKYYDSEDWYDTILVDDFRDFKEFPNT